MECFTMAQTRRYYVSIFLLQLAFVSSQCLADLALLSDNDMKGAITEEGVCDFQRPDLCNTDPELAGKMSAEAIALNKATVGITTSSVGSTVSGHLDPSQTISIQDPASMQHQDDLMNERIENVWSTLRSYLDTLNRAQ
jgi:hypothetical protein